MNSLNAASLVNLLGFTVGVALYALLGAMVLRHRKAAGARKIDLLLLATAFLGLMWNAGELFVVVRRDFAASGAFPMLTAASYAALGFLPSVVVHSAQDSAIRARWLTGAAYALSIFAAILHFQAAIAGQSTPSDVALLALTVGSIALVIGLLFLNFRQTLERKTIWAAALLIFAVSALHLSGEREESSLFVELVAHQSSLPLALAILYQNYRFAFGDLFLKRAISLIFLAFAAFGLYMLVAAPLLRYHETHDRDDVLAISLILTLWIATALAYPSIHRLAVWLVDKVILKRADYGKFQLEIAGSIETVESIDEILDLVSARLAKVLTANSAGWSERAEQETEIKLPLVEIVGDDASVMIPVAEGPAYQIELREFYGGRRLLSEETAMLESVAMITARRIDAVRVSHERCEQELREQEFSKLATEAQLTALRSQINPHFLFNALTTIGYLIQTEPDKAFATLLHLTKLLRSVLTSTAEFWTVEEELTLVQDYLDIERARFEERLMVSIDVPPTLKNFRIPSLILQPLVENAIKHAVSENKLGGEVVITARVGQKHGKASLRLEVADTGSGKISAPRKSSGVGLRNIRERLASHYSGRASLSIEGDSLAGTVATIEIPVAAEVV